MENKDLKNYIEDVIVLLEDRWSFRPRLGEEGARKMTELMVVQLENRLSSRPRLGEEGGREDRIYGGVAGAGAGAGVAGGQVELMAQAGVGGRQGENRIHGSAA